MVKMTKEEFQENLPIEDVNAKTWRAELLKRTMSGEPIGSFPVEEQLKQLMQATRRSPEVVNKGKPSSLGLFGGRKPESPAASPLHTPPVPPKKPR